MTEKHRVLKGPLKLFRLRFILSHNYFMVINGTIVFEIHHLDSTELLCTTLLRSISRRDDQFSHISIG